MTMRFGRLQCIRCTMIGHLSYQCGKPILPIFKEEPEPPPPPPEYTNEIADLYDAWLC